MPDSPLLTELKGFSDKIAEILGNRTSLLTTVKTSLVSAINEVQGQASAAFGWGNHALAGYLTGYSETDPIFTAHASSGITPTQITNWDASYGWGNHASAGYALTSSLGSAAFVATSTFATAAQGSNADTAYGWGNHATVGYLTSYTETDPIFTAHAANGITSTQISHWDTAYGWGNHASAGYVSSSSLGNFTESTSSVLTITGGTGAIVGSGLTVQVKAASGSQSGYLSSTDWTTFNGKQAALVSETNIKSLNGNSLVGSGSLDLGTVINGLTGKTTPVDGDYVDLMDSAASNAAKKLSWSNIKATLKAYFDTLYAPITPFRSSSANTTATLSDANGVILHPSSDTTARTFTIDSNANVAYSTGTSITFINQTSAGVLTIAITSDTMQLLNGGTVSTGSRTLAANGSATAVKIASTTWVIYGVGLT